MPKQGDLAPDFTVPLANNDIEAFRLSDHLHEAPIVLAFFPGAFTSVCTTEMQTFQNRLSDFQDAGVTLYGVSVDTPFSLNEFREQQELSFGLLSDTNKELIDVYDVRMDFDDIGFRGVAERAVFIVDDSRTISYKWVGDNPSVEPEYDTILEAAESTT